MPLPTNLRQDFPFLSQKHPTGKPWIYLDSAATTLKPRQVIGSVTNALTNHSANVHRSVYGPGDVTTEQFENARRKIARFIGAQAHEVVFVRNTTEALNLVARSYPRRGTTLVSWGEHHSNLLPWQNDLFTGITPLPDGRPNLEAMSDELKKGQVSVVSISHISNVTGFQTEIRQFAEVVHRHGAVLVVDAAQSAGRIPIDVTELDCDFLACSGHKMYGPTGIGILYGKAERLLELQPHFTGGGTVEVVSHGKSEWRALPWRLEAGTPPIEATLGLGAAVDYLQELGMENLTKHESRLIQLAMDKLASLPKCHVIGGVTTAGRMGVVSFYITNESSHVIARTLSDRFGICLRSGHHCAQPLHDSLKAPPTLRLSLGLYNTRDDIDHCISALGEIVRYLRRTP